MINKSKDFYQEICNMLQQLGYECRILEDYNGRFFENPQAVLATNAPTPYVHFLIGLTLMEETGGNEIDIVNEMNKLSHDQLGKDTFLYY